MTTTFPSPRVAGIPIKRKRIESIDLLRGIVMIIMALDHTRDYFHRVAFVYSPTDLSHTSPAIFFTRFITHYCAPIFVFLAGVSAYLYGSKKSKSALRRFLITRGIWLVFVEVFIISLFRSFNPLYPFISLQVIWAIGICMIVLAAFINVPRQWILFISLAIIFGHNLLDAIHLSGNGVWAVLWALVHDENHFTVGSHTFFVHYPVLPWIGIMLAGYYVGYFYTLQYNAAKRKKILLVTGISAISLFLLLRSGNFYGDADHWWVQKNTMFTILSFFNVTKYPPSLLYTLITLGPGLIFLHIAESASFDFTQGRLFRISQAIKCFGRVPMFYYLAHILLIHIFALIAAWLSGYTFGSMFLHGPVYMEPALKGYGFPLIVVYVVWLLVVVLLYPLCKIFDRYKMENGQRTWWLSYV